MIEVQKLRKSFGPRVALVGVDLKVDAGTFVALVGPNGAGKTTLLRILAMLSRPTLGVVRIADMDVTKSGPDVRRLVGFLSHRSLLYEDLTAQQNLQFYARMYGVPDAQARIAALLERVGLTSRRDDLVRTFSRGMQQRLSVARAVLHHPRVLLLDEPYSGLDPVATQTLTDLLVDLVEEGCTLLLTTHNLDSGLAAAQRAVVLLRGRIVDDTLLTEPGAFPARYRAVVQGSLL